MRSTIKWEISFTEEERDLQQAFVSEMKDRGFEETQTMLVYRLYVAVFLCQHEVFGMSDLIHEYYSHQPGN